MKVDTSRLKKGTSDVPTECQALIEKLRSCSMDELVEELHKIDTWTFGKSELYHWIDVLDIFDGILEEATKQIGKDWFLACDERFTPKKVQLLLAVLNFTTLLIEHSFSRHLYNSVEHLTQLLSSTNMEIVLGVLNLLYMFSKRSNFIPRLNLAKRTALVARLTYIAESWGGKEHGYGLAECCQKSMEVSNSIPKFYYEYYDSDGNLKSIEQDELSGFIGITNPSEIAYLMCCQIPNPIDDDQKMLIFTRVRLSLAFHNYESRLQFVMARLQALSVLVYSNSVQENFATLLYPGFLEELVELLELRDTKLVEIRAAALRTLTSIIHLDRNPNFPKKPGSRLLMIIDVTGASSYHGFLPTLVRTCIQYLTTTPNSLSEVSNTNSLNSASQQQPQFPLALATALFSFLYHLASYDSGGEALVACGMMESLLRVINWPGKELEHITFVTRAVRVIDLITNIEMQSFQSHGGLQSFIGRLEMEVNICREDQPSELIPSNLDRSHDANFVSTDDTVMYETNPPSNASSSSSSCTTITSTNTNTEQTATTSAAAGKTHQKSCLPQRAALLKSMLNFLKKAMQDTAFSESIRHVMESSLPISLRHIISNAEYYGPSLFLLATDVVTVYVFQEPSLLYSLQDSGLTDVVLQALLKKDVPPTREVLGSLPNVFSALCLNSRGLAAFVQYKPFDRLFEVLLSPVYLQAMRRRRSSDPMGDTAANLGNATDDLMRHQPSLKTEATKAIIRLLEELVKLGTDDKYICWRAQNSKIEEINSTTNASATVNPTNSNNGGNRQAIHLRVRAGENSSQALVLHVNSSMNRNTSIVNVNHNIIDHTNTSASSNSIVETGSEDDDDEEEASTSSHHNQRDGSPTINCSKNSNAENTSGSPIRIPLIDYILNVMKFVDAILSNNSTDDHCREFVTQGGLKPLLRILSLPNLPVDSPITASAQAVAAVCKSILSLAHEPQVLRVSLEQLAIVVDNLEPLQSHWEVSQGSVLLRELANCRNIESAFSNAAETPLLHAMSAVHGYVVMLVHICRTGQSEIRNLLIEQWGQNNKYGQKLLYKLVQLYTALVWESTLLLALCTDDIIPSGCDFGKDDLDKLPKEKTPNEQNSSTSASTSSSSNVNASSTDETLSDHMPSSISSNSLSKINSEASESMTDLFNENSMDIDRVLNLFDSIDKLPKEKNTNEPSTSEEAKQNASKNTGKAAPSTSSKAGPSQRRNTATPSQLRYIKSLLGASSRLGRALAELFGLLVKLCVGNRMRLRHPQSVATNYMSMASRDIARVLSYILVDGLSHDQLPPSPIPKLKQTFLICSIGFTSPMLFDEKRFAYHLMLSKFCEEGGLQAFSEMFGFALDLDWDKSSTAMEVDVPSSSASNKATTSSEQIIPKTEASADKQDETSNVADADRTVDSLILPKEPISNVDHNEFPGGSGEFLDAWLMLLEKMVNPKAILESPNVITTKLLPKNSEFDTVSYLINVHILAYETVTKIWSFKPISTYGARMTESMLTIMKHIYQGAPILREKYNKKFSETALGTKEKNISKLIADFSRVVHRMDRIDASTRPTASGAARSSHSMANADAPPVNEAHLNQLMDMGFLAEHCREALYHTGSVEQATEYLLSNTTRPLSHTNASNDLPSGIIAYIDSDDDENNDAEMMVLMGQKATNDADGKPDASSSNAYAKRNRRGMKTQITALPNKEPLSEQLLANFAEEAVCTSLYLIDQVPDAVFKGTELLGILFKRPEIKWKMLATMIGTMIDCAEQLRALLTDRVTSYETIFSGEIGTRFTARLHIFSLFLDVPQYQELRTSTILSMKEFKLMPKLIGLLNETEDYLTSKAGKCSTTPKWLSQMITLIDLYEKVVISIRRRNEMHRITTSSWKWYDIQTGKWTAYSSANNKVINEAYWAGEPTVRISVGRQRYTINFNCMSQVNEETGNHRPVVLGLASSVVSQRVQEHVSATLSFYFGLEYEENSNSNDAKTKQLKPNKKIPTRAPAGNATPSASAPSTSTAAPTNPTNYAQPDNTQLDRITTAAIIEMRDSHLLHGFKSYYTVSTLENANKQDKPQAVTPDDGKLCGLEEFSTENIVATCVRLISPTLALDRDSIHALLMLCVRLTTKYSNAEVFAREGGIKILLEMKQAGGFGRGTTLANLLIRHTLEEPQALALAMEKVIAARTLQTIPPGYRDLIFMLRRMSSAVARDPEIFKQIARSMLCIDGNALRRGVLGEDYRLIMRSVPATKRTIEKPNESSIAAKVIYDLLQALTIPIANQKQTYEEKIVSSAGRNQGRHSTTASFIISAPHANPTFGANNATASDIIEETLFRHSRPLDDNDISFIAMSITGSANDHHSNHLSGGTSANIRDESAIHVPNINDTTSTKHSQNSALNDGWNASSGKNGTEKALLPKAIILKALAEAVRSYHSVGELIAEYTYQPQPNTLIRKPQPALEFILDNLLPGTDQNPDRECSAGARTLIAALSASTDSQVTQYTVVTELRKAFLRALAWPEITEKHLQIQLLAALIPAMIENCPNDNPPGLVRMHPHPHQTKRSDICDIMVRKGLISDLANITQSLDLSSPQTIGTIGVTLKSLEQLLRMSNQPLSSVTLQFNKKRAGLQMADSTYNEVADANDEANDGNEETNDASPFEGNAQNGEQNDNNRDASNLEQDVSNENEPATNQDTAEMEDSETVAEMIESETPTNTSNTNAAEAEDSAELNDLVSFIGNARDDVQPLDSEVLEEIRRRISDQRLILEADPLDGDAPGERIGRGSGNATTVAGGSNSTNSATGLPAVELQGGERFISEEDETSTDSDGTEENDDEREEESNGDDDNEDEAEDRSDLEVDEETRFIEMYDVYGRHLSPRHLSPSIPELERDNEDILMIQYADSGRDEGGNNDAENVAGNPVDVSVNVANNIIDVDNDQPTASNSNAVPSTSGMNRVPVAAFQNIFDANMRDLEGVSANGDASNESANGPQILGRLRIATGNPRANGLASGSNPSNTLSQLIQIRSQRNSNRQRRCNVGLGSRSSNPPAILQRLLGPTVAQHVNSLGQVIANANGSASFRDATRVVVMDNSFGILSNPGEPSIDLLDQSGYLYGRSLAATLNNTPAALHWWLEETKALGMESQTDVCLTICNDLIPELEAQRAAELAKSRNKRKKKSSDNLTKLDQTNKEKSESGEQNANTDELTLAQAARTGGSAHASHTTNEDATATNESNAPNANNATITETLNLNEDNIEQEDHYDSDEVDDEESNDEVDEDVDDNAEEVEDEEDEEDEADDDEDELNELPHLIHTSFVESNEEMSDGNVNEVEETEDNGGGSASDSGRSVESSVSTEPFFSVGQSEHELAPAASRAIINSSNLPTETASPNPINQLSDENQQSEQTRDSGSNINAGEDLSGQSASFAITEPSTSSEPSSQMRATKESEDEREKDPRQQQNKQNNDDEEEEGEVITVLSSGDDDNEDDDDDDDDEDSVDDENTESSVENKQDSKRQRLNIDEDTQQSTSNISNDIESRENTRDSFRANALRDGTNTPNEMPNLSVSNANENTSHNRNVGSAGSAGSVETNLDIAMEQSTTNDIAEAAIPQEANSDAVGQNNGTNTNSEGNNGGASSTAQVGGIQVPEGIDPSFLAALPEEMRDEVIAEHLRIQRMQERTRQQQQVSVQNEQQAIVEVNPEFLAALPPNIQEEVLAQQRIEQQRLAAASANPNDPVDAAAFFQNLQPSLRQAILTDMEDSQISVLPPELAAEAQNLRRDWETRNRQIMQEQMSQIGGNSGNVGTSPSFSSVLRYRSRLPEPIFTTHNLQRMRWSNWGINSHSASIDRDLIPTGTSLLCLDPHGEEPQLSHESLTSLLILLFVEANKICTLRFHRVIRNLCCHIPTRDWIIRTILSIIERSNVNARQNDPHQTISNRPYWLNIRLDAALGNRNNIFIIKRKCHANEDDMEIDDISNVSSITDEYSIAIHPQAAQTVCRHALDLLIALAKAFPANFLPIKKERSPKKKSTQPTDESQPSTSKAETSEEPSKSIDFWDILLRLEMRARQDKANNVIGLARVTADAIRPEDFKTFEFISFSDSPFGQLISMLSFDIILKSTLLTDKLLRLLSFISIGLPDAVHLMALSIATTAEPAAERQETGTENAATASNTAVTANDTAMQTTPEPIHPKSESSESSESGDKCLPQTHESLRLAIEVLTSKSCSEEGLEDATSLLLNLSQCSNVTRTFILNLLIDGSKYLAGIVQEQINDLIVDLKQLNQRNRQETGTTAATPMPSYTTETSSNDSQALSYNTMPSSSGASKGILQDRFTKEKVIITSASKQKTRCELQLPSMVPLISKMASQSFFLRILKVVIQIRESANKEHSYQHRQSRQQQSRHQQSSSVAQQLQQQQQQQQQPQQQSSSQQTTDQPREDASQQTQPSAQAKEQPQSSKNVASPPSVQPILSEILQLDDLWNTLSDCLVELEENADHHAVLVLQPAVEAFFLVHATPAPNTKSSNQQNEQENRTQSARNADANASATRPPDTNNGSSSDSQTSETREPTADTSNRDADDNQQQEQEPQQQQQPQEISPVSPISLFDLPSNSRSEPAQSQSTDPPDNLLAKNNLTGVAQPEPSPKPPMTSDQKKFLQFAEKHKTVLNQILRQSTVHLSDGPFAVLVDHTRILDFDVKRRYFRTELERMDEGLRREELSIHVHRVTVFEDSFRDLYRRNPEEWKNRFYIVFEDEEGQDAGGLLREWYVIISREIFNPMYALFTVSPGDRVTYMINPSSHANSNHLFYFKFVGRVIAKAIYDNKLLECYFTRSFYKHILGIEVNTQDMENEDYEFYKGLVYLMENHVSALGYEQTFSLEVQEFGVTEVRDLIPNGRNIAVTEENKFNYIHLVCQLKMSGSIKQQLNAFLEGFYDIIPKRLISIFNEQELELLISGLPNVDIEDLKANTEYHKYQAKSNQIQWFWRALRSFDQADRAKFLQFVTGTSKVPLQGFGALEGMNGVQKFQIHRDDRSTERLPSAHTCFNQLDLPVYKTYDKLRSSLLKAIHECSEGFAFA